MSVAVCTIGCDRKANEGFPSWPVLFDLEGDYSIYYNYQIQQEFITQSRLLEAQATLAGLAASKQQAYSFDKWEWNTSSGKPWRGIPKFDQDSARHASTVCGRNMCIEYAFQTGASHLLFVDTDIIPPLDIIPKMLEVMQDTGKLAVGGLVHGRGVHQSCPYIFGEKRRWREQGKYDLVEVEHGNIGFTMLSRKLFEAVRFRYGMTMYEDGRNHMTSDDPAYHADCYLKFHEWPVIRLDIVGRHVGDLKQEDAV